MSSASLLSLVYEVLSFVLTALVLAIIFVVVGGSIVLGMDLMRKFERKIGVIA
jgi:predicted permease